MAEPVSPEGIAERAECKGEDDNIDFMTGRLVDLMRRALPDDCDFVVVVAKERRHYVHLCTAGVVAPSDGVRYLEKAIVDLKARAH